MRAFTFTSLILLLSCASLSVNAQDDCPVYYNMMDQAWVRFFYNKPNPLQGPQALAINFIDTECYRCAEEGIINITTYNIFTNQSYFQFSTAYGGTFYVHDLFSNQLLTSLPYSLNERGNYTMNATDVYDSTGAWTGVTLQIITDKEGDNIYIPIYVAIGVLVGVALLYNLGRYLIVGNGKKLWRSDRKKILVSEESQIREGLLEDSMNDNSQNRAATPVNTDKSPAKAKNTKERLLSLDTFRGISLCIMLFVNAGAGGYVELDHTAWNGLHLADLVFPWFIWMMGVSMAISFASQQRRGATKKDMLKKVLVRSAKLAALGIMTSNSGAPFDQMRIPGVLMRFAISYLVVSLIIIYVPKYIRPDDEGYRFVEIRQHVYEFIPVFLLMVLWLGLTFGLQVPGCPTGYIGPGGQLGDYGQYPDCTGGAAGYIDKQILGLNHIYDSPTPQPIYHTGSYDPEGILGCLTSIMMVYIGLMAGRVIIYYKTHKDRITRWLGGAVFLGCFSLLLCHASKNEGWIPINKNMWSLSFIVTLSCFALLVLPTLYVIIDVLKLWGGGPFKAMGMNSITIYCGSDFVGSYFPLSFLPSTDNGCWNPTADTHGWILFANLENAIFWLIIANWMDYEKFYINL